MPVDRNLRILIVDDQDSFLEIMRAMLRQLGFRNVDVAKNGAAAVVALVEATDRYGLVISDWNMQPMSGLQLLQTIRGEPDLKTIPFVMVTGEASKDRIVAAAGAGVTAYLAKPVSLDAVKKRLVKILGEF
jgi:two-component system chemotaxis response regulator CheY